MVRLLSITAVLLSVLSAACLSDTGNSTEKALIKNWLLALTKEEKEKVLSDPFVRRNFVKHVLEVEGAYRKAVEQGFLEDPWVKKRIEMVVKETVATIWVKREVEKNLRNFRLSDEDIKEYYKLHIDEFKGKDGKIKPLGRVKGLIKRKLIDMKRKALIDEILRKAIKDLLESK